MSGRLYLTMACPKPIILYKPFMIQMHFNFIWVEVFRILAFRTGATIHSVRNEVMLGSSMFIKFLHPINEFDPQFTTAFIPSVIHPQALMWYVHFKAGNSYVICPDYKILQYIKLGYMRSCGRSRTTSTTLHEG